MKNKKISIRIKPTVEEFTQEMFYFMVEKNPFEEACELLRPQFYEIIAALNVDFKSEDWGLLKDIFKRIQNHVEQDAIATERNDPAAKSLSEVYLAYPGFYAITIYRISHELYKLKIPILPRMMSEYAHSYTGADIHPGAVIGDSFFIDHATGIVIGETTNIGNHVKIYQGVTLGAFHIRKDMGSDKRHPTIKDNVTIYANATILGGQTIIGDNTTIGGSVWLTESVPKDSFVSYQTEIKTIVKK